MDNYIEVFNKRWKAVEKETLSSVRRQLKAYSFDISEINHGFQKSCNEWFNGKLAPSIWYKELSISQPEKAQAFKDYINRIRLNGSEPSKPTKLWAYLTTVLSLPVTYWGVSSITKWELLGKSVFAIGIGVLVWTACQSRIISQSNKYEEMIVSLYQEQLERHGKKLNQILS